MWTRKNPVLKFANRDSAQCLASKRGYAKARATITTLDPERLHFKDFVDVSSLASRKIHARLEDGRTISGQIFYSNSNSRGYPRFPPKTQGFLYYHHHPQLPHTTGEIRFRVTESFDPACFHNGTDLLRHDVAVPWSLSLLKLSSTHAPFKELLSQDYNIPLAILDYKRKSGSFLTYLEQPFVLTLEQYFTLRVIDSHLRTVSAFGCNLLPMPGNHKKPAFRGKLLVRFEQASPSEHENDISFVMRVLKVLEPIQPLADAALLPPTPEAGTLLKWMSYGQIRTLSFRNQFLRPLPSITKSSPSPSDLISIKATLVGPSARAIGTLDPRRLTAIDFMKVTGKTEVQLYTRDDPRMSVSLQYAAQDGSRVAFPANAQGFLYMYLKPGLPLLSGQIRFRSTPSDDPTQFEKGTDLQGLFGYPWSIGPLQLVQEAYAPLKEQLARDGYLEMIEAISRLPQDARRLPPILCYLEQPFVLDMSHRSHGFTFLSHDGIIDGLIQGIFFDYTRGICPYTGRLVLRFERSTLPHHANRNVVVLRVLKTLDPIKFVDPHYDEHLPVPRVGELLITTRGRVRSHNLNFRRTVCGLGTLPSIPDEPDLESFR